MTGEKAGMAGKKAGTTGRNREWQGRESENNSQNSPRHSHLPPLPPFAPFAPSRQIFHSRLARRPLLRPRRPPHQALNGVLRGYAAEHYVAGGLGYGHLHAELGG